MLKETIHHTIINNDMLYNTIKFSQNFPMKQIRKYYRNKYIKENLRELRQEVIQKPLGQVCIETTSLCNTKCSFCPHDSMKREKMVDTLESLCLTAAGIDLPDAQYYEKLGNDFADLKSYEKAIQNYKRAIQINNDYASAYVSLGMLLERLGKYNDASENFKKALELDPGNTDAASHLEQLNLIQGNTAGKEKE